MIKDTCVVECSVYLGFIPRFTVLEISLKPERLKLVQFSQNLFSNDVRLNFAHRTARGYNTVRAAAKPGPVRASGGPRGVVRVATLELLDFPSRTIYILWLSRATLREIQAALAGWRFSPG